jgi:hypothetical protein
MAKTHRVELLQGTFDPLTLRTVLFNRAPLAEG